MLAADRLEVIADLVREWGSVRGSELVEMLGVTDETVRRDLSPASRSSGSCAAPTGGAVAAPSQRRDHHRRSTAREHAEAKIAIGRRAAELVAARHHDHPRLRAPRPCASREPCGSFATSWSSPRPSRTRSSSSGNPGHDRHHDRRRDPPDHLRRERPPGRGDAPRSCALTRPSSPSTASPSRGGLTYPSFEEVDAKRAMIECRRRGDPASPTHSKFGREALVRVAPVTAVHRIITTLRRRPGRGGRDPSTSASTSSSRSRPARFARRSAERAVEIATRRLAAPPAGHPEGG